MLTRSGSRLMPPNPANCRYNGTSYSASFSYDGQNYVPIGTPVTLASAAAQQDGGIFSTSHNTTQSAINEFDSVAITTAAGSAS